jgi:probable HAF family extracellular repeat protein
VRVTLSHVRMLRGVVLLGLSVTSVSLTPISAGRPEVKIRELPPLPADSQSFGNDINAPGNVVGVSMTADENGTPTRVRPMLWRKGRAVRLPLPEGAEWGWAYGLNDRGVYTGISGVDPRQANDEKPGDGQVTLWKNGQVRVLPGLAGGQPSYGSDVNNRGQIGGAAWNPAGRKRAVLWEGGRITQVCQPLEGDTESSWSVINAKGHGCGISYTLDSEGKRATVHAVRFRNGKTVALPVPEGFTESAAYCINDHGQIVGYAVDPEGHTHGMVWEHGDVRDLGIPEGATDSTADANNDKGQIVGTATLSETEFLTVQWTKKGARPLNGRLSRPRWSNMVPYVLNDRGQLCGGGTHNERDRGYVLTLPGAK